ncbi:MAG: hypothetical protein JKY54_06315, partial [Flavobacteriales bacterium]|nr:hypothetical protein [Flavobacteriales bacterium]
GTSLYASEEDVLIYKIRFQNIGNYAARIVNIVDHLSPKLNWDSFELLNASHPFTVSFSNGTLRWYNDNIELPDSTTNPEGSQGYVSFSIRPNKGLSRFESIENKAEIRFDYNEYITTNTTSILINVPDVVQAKSKMYLQPNPATDLVNVNVLNSQEKSKI